MLIPPFAFVIPCVTGAVQELPLKFVHIEPPPHVSSPVIVSVAGPNTTPPVSVHVPGHDDPQSLPPRNTTIPLLACTVPVAMLLNAASTKLLPVPLVFFNVPALLNTLPAPLTVILPSSPTSHTPLAGLFTIAARNIWNEKPAV